MNVDGLKRLMFSIAYPLAIAMLILWAVVTFAFSGPGWIHLFLSLGVFLLIWRIVAGGTAEAWRKYVSKR
jgi:ABC-type transport system involved in cytochrome bd biosynthesis fused ATPase/permease subunit